MRKSFWGTCVVNESAAFNSGPFSTKLLVRLLSELRERTEEVEKLNQHLEQRVADQCGRIGISWTLGQRVGQTFPLRHKISGPNPWKKTI